MSQRQKPASASARVKTASSKKPRQKTQDELATDYHVSQRTIRSWEKEGAPLGEPGKMAEWIKARRSKLVSDKPAMEALKLRRLELQCDLLQQEKDESDGRLIRSEKYEQLIAEHFGGLRQQIRNLLLTEQPVALAGRCEVDIRELNRKTYDALCRRMQNAAGKLSVPGRNPLPSYSSEHPTAAT